MTKAIDNLLKSQGKISIFILCSCLVALSAVLDYLTGYEISFFIFYGVPIWLAVWYGGKKFGLAFAVISIIGWSVADILTGHQYSHFLIPYWNGAIRFAFFVFTAIALNSMKEKIILEELNANIDALTGVLNGRGFRSRALALYPLMRREKKPYALAFIDIDNFKTINDTRGHAEGDIILKKVAEILQLSVRGSDLVGRLGGDEFVVLLPHTDEKQAERVLLNLKDSLDETVANAGWPIGFSIGIGVFDSAATEIEQGIKMADILMYTAKNKGKGRIICEDMTKAA